MLVKTRNFTPEALSTFRDLQRFGGEIPGFHQHRGSSPNPSQPSITRPLRQSLIDAEFEGMCMPLVGPVSIGGNEPPFVLVDWRE